MKGANMITRNHVEELLQSRAEAATLILLEGRVMVVPAAELGTDRFRGALEVVSREALTGRFGPSLTSEEELDEVASRLDATVAHLGA
jgi:hypothetical protein